VSLLGRPENARELLRAYRPLIVIVRVMHWLRLLSESGAVEIIARCCDTLEVMESPHPRAVIPGRPPHISVSRYYAEQAVKKLSQRTLPCGCVGTTGDVRYVEYGGWACDTGWSTCELCGAKWVAHTGSPLIDVGSRDGVRRP
jgi:hypothetical protein